MDDGVWFGRSPPKSGEAIMEALPILLINFLMWVHTPVQSGSWANVFLVPPLAAALSAM